MKFFKGDFFSKILELITIFFLGLTIIWEQTTLAVGFGTFSIWWRIDNLERSIKERDNERKRAH